MVFDYAKSEQDRQVMQLVFGWEVMERPVAAPPDVPAYLIEALRDGFDATMNDAAFKADIDKASLAYGPMSGKEISAFIDEVYQTPTAVAERAAQLLGRKR
jgi:tripartite-type tricarboxylate transporter receptor subunit TctC